MSPPICQLSAAGSDKRPWEVKGSPRLSSSRRREELYLSLDPCRGRWWTRFLLFRLFSVLRVFFFFFFFNVLRKMKDWNWQGLSNFFFFFFVRILNYCDFLIFLLIFSNKWVGELLSKIFHEIEEFEEDLLGYRILLSKRTMV